MERVGVVLHRGVKLSKAPSLTKDEGSGLIVQALKTITDAYKIGGYLLVAMVAGTFIITLSLFIKFENERLAALAVGILLLVLPLLAALAVYLRPLHDLKRQLDEKAAFLRATEEGVVNMAQTVRSFAEAVVANHKNMAEALREARTYLDNFPVLANWVDNSEDLSNELMKLAMGLRDSGTSIENAFRHGDTEALRLSIAKAQQIAVKMNATASPTRLIASVNDGLATRLDELKNSEVLAKLNEAISLIANGLDYTNEPGKERSADSISAIISLGVKALNASNKVENTEGTTPEK